MPIHVLAKEKEVEGEEKDDDDDDDSWIIYLYSIYPLTV